MQMSYGINECSFHKPGDAFCEKSLNVSLIFRKKMFNKLVFQKTVDFS